eukprot:s1481_g8.t1
MSSRPPSSQSSPALRPLGSPPRFSSTAPAFLEPLEPGRIMSPLAGVRPVTVAPTLPPMVPTAWDNDREDPTAFQAPSFETIGKPIRLKFCQEWYEKVFGAAANSIPDILDANNWLPPDTPVKLKLPGKLRQKMGLEPMGSNHGSSTNSPRSVTSRTSTQDGGAGRKGRKGRRKSSELREVTEIVEKDERHWAAVQLQCMARCWKARVNVARKKRRTKAQVLIASCFRGYLTRTGRRALVKRMKTRQSEIALVIPQLSLEKMDPFEQELDLRYVHLGEETHQLAPMMHHLQSLLLLELLGNYIGSKGLLPLVRILQKQPNLKYLGLAWNGLGDDSSKSLVPWWSDVIREILQGQMSLTLHIFTHRVFAIDVAMAMTESIPPSDGAVPGAAMVALEDYDEAPECHRSLPATGKPRLDYLDYLDFMNIMLVNPGHAFREEAEVPSIQRLYLTMEEQHLQVLDRLRGNGTGGMKVHHGQHFHEPTMIYWLPG